MSKVQARFSLHEDSLDYIEAFTVNNRIPRDDRNEGLERILQEHKELKERSFSLEYITDTVTENVTRSVQISLQHSISKEINRIRLGTNNVDRNTQILIELIQGFMQMQKLNHIITTDLNKPEFLIDIENLIQDRITLQKQKKDNKQ